MATLQDVMAVDGGEAYICFLLPDAAESFRNKNRKFKIRPEKTPSCSLFKHREHGFWMVKDHGSSDAAMNAINLKMFLHDVDFGTAMREATQFYQLEEGTKQVDNQAEYSNRVANPDEHPGQYKWELKEFDTHELRALFSDGAWYALGNSEEARKKKGIELCQYYRFKAVKWYSQVGKDGSKVHIFGSNERFPIFLIDEGGFQKLYKPKDSKEYRFLWIGEKPERYVHGLAQHIKKYEERVAEAEKALTEAKERGDDKAKMEETRLPEIILCTGGSDALNVAACGFHVIWLNSESAILPWSDYRSIARICERLYNLPDIDATGVKEARALALQYIEIRTIWLPEELRLRVDWRGNPCKDVRDFFRYWHKRDFKGLVETAYPFRFWDEEFAYTKEGVQIFKFGRPKMSYQFNNVYGYNFLYHMGFGRLVSDKEKEGFFFVRVQNGRVKRLITATEIKAFLHGFAESYVFPDGKRVNEDLRNVLFRSPQLSETSLANIRTIEPDFRYYGRDFQYIYFSHDGNKGEETLCWKVQANKIEKVITPDVCVWDTKVLRIETMNDRGQKRGHKPALLDKFFEIKKENGRWDIVLNSEPCDFLKFLIQSSKLHWKAETQERLEFWEWDTKTQNDYLEKNGLTEEHRKLYMKYQDAKLAADYKEATRFRLDGELLLPEEVEEQKLALVNKLFAIGYMLHRHKDPTKTWAGFVMDYRISDEGASNGGAGKGLLAKALYKWLNYVSIDGRNEKIFDNPHIYENVDKDTDMIHMEDWSEFQNFTNLYTATTSSINVNPKNKRSIVLNYNEFGKFWIDTNFGDRYTDMSSKRRKLYVVFGDWYHEDTEQYREIRTPKTELGRSIFDDWDVAEWNRFHNLFGQCLAFYLGTEEKIEPPTGNVNKRNLLSTMGDNFRGWADVYFDTTSDRLNTYVQKIPAMEDFNRETRLKVTSQLFMKKLRAWAKYHGYECNPDDLLEGKERIVRSVEVAGKDGTRRQSTAEMLYIRTAAAPVPPVEVLPEDKTMPF
jgi:hypothetical protein